MYVTEIVSSDASPQESSESRSDDSQVSVVNTVENVAADDSVLDQGQNIQGHNNHQGQSHQSQENKENKGQQSQAEHLLSSITGDGISSDFTTEVATVVPVNTKEDSVSGQERPVSLGNDSQCDMATDFPDTEEMYNPLHPTNYAQARTASLSEQSESQTEIIETSTAEIVDSESRSEDHSDSLRVGEVDNSASHSESDHEHTDSESTFDRNSYSVERSQIRSSVSEAVQNLQRQNLEPVVSLHYCSEGTSAGTIRVRFAQFDNLEEEMTEQNPGLVLTRVTNNAPGADIEHSEAGLDASSEIESERVDSETDTHCDTFDSIEIENEENKSLSDVAGIFQGVSGVVSEVNDSKDVKGDCDEDGAKAGTCAMNNNIKEEDDLEPFCPEPLQEQNTDKFVGSIERKDKIKGDEHDRVTGDTIGDVVTLTEKDIPDEASDSSARTSAKVSGSKNDLLETAIDDSAQVQKENCVSDVGKSEEVKAGDTDTSVSRGANPGTSGISGQLNTESEQTRSGLTVVVSDDNGPVQSDNNEQDNRTHRSNSKWLLMYFFLHNLTFFNDIAVCISRSALCVSF